MAYVARVWGEAAAQFSAEVLATREPVRGCLCHRLGEHRIQQRQLWSLLADGRWWGRNVFGNGDGGGRRVIRFGPGQEVKRRAGQRVLVRAPIDRLPHQLFGRGVRHRAHGHVRGRQPRGVIDAAGDAEVGQINPPRVRIGILQQDVGRFDIAVQQPALMRVVQRRGHRGEDLQRQLDCIPSR